MKAILLYLLFFILNTQALIAQEIPFHKGINLTGWFQASNVRQVQFTKYTKKDFEQIKNLGCDVIRLPINLHSMTYGAPNYTIDPLFYTFLDEAVNWAEDLQLHLILDNHTFSVTTDTDPNVGIILEKVWRQVAAHYKNRSKFIYYEVLNEPHGISDAQWNAIQKRVVDVIRTVDTKHTIIIGPAGWNSYNNLNAMPVYSDSNLIYTFHFYDPFVFTHQGASWTGMQDLGSVPFPYQASRMPALPASLRGTWVESAYHNYKNEGTVNTVKQLIDIAVQFKQNRKVRIYCGEFGVYIPKSNNSERVFWYDTVRKYLEEKNIPWTIWDYHGGFGLYKEGGNDLFEHDLNVPLLQSLGLNVPTQTPFQISPDNTGFFIYDDYIGNKIVEASYNDGIIDIYSQDQPNNGLNVIYWTNANQHNTIGFKFKPIKDLSELVNNNYALQFWVRGDTPGTIFDIRFLDTKTSEPTDHPWRIRVTINERLVNWNNQWQQVRIPLKNFREQGAWDNGWFPPEGKFDWKSVDRLEIVAEQRALQNVKLWFDNIQIINTLSTEVAVTHTNESVKIFPNPVANYFVVESKNRGRLNYQVLNSMGQILMDATFNQQANVDISHLASGVYWLKIAEGGQVLSTRKIVKL